MKQAKINIANGLKSSAALAAIVGNRISDAWPAENAVYPRVIYLQVTGTGEKADGRTIGFDEIYQISLFAKPMPGKSVTMILEDMAMAVLDVMDDIGASLVGNSDLLIDGSEGIKQKPLRFRYITRR